MYVYGCEYMYMCMHVCVHYAWVLPNMVYAGLCTLEEGTGFVFCPSACSFETGYLSLNLELELFCFLTRQESIKTQSPSCLPTTLFGTEVT